MLFEILIICYWTFLNRFRVVNVRIAMQLRIFFFLITIQQSVSVSLFCFCSSNIKALTSPEVSWRSEENAQKSTGVWLEISDRCEMFSVSQHRVLLNPVGFIPPSVCVFAAHPHADEASRTDGSCCLLCKYISLTDCFGDCFSGCCPSTNSSEGLQKHLMFMTSSHCRVHSRRHGNKNLFNFKI